jgi:hypothetical protein
MIPTTWGRVNDALRLANAIRKEDVKPVDIIFLRDPDHAIADEDGFRPVAWCECVPDASSRDVEDYLSRTASVAEYLRCIVAGAMSEGDEVRVVIGAAREPLPAWLCCNCLDCFKDAVIFLQQFGIPHDLEAAKQVRNTRERGTCWTEDEWRRMLNPETNCAVPCSPSP